MIANIRKSRLASLDREHINKTKLRASRVDKLKSLLGDDCNLPLIPDGLADDGTQQSAGAIADTPDGTVPAASGDSAGAGAATGVSSTDAAADVDMEGREDAPELVGALSCYACKRRCVEA